VSGVGGGVDEFLERLDRAEVLLREHSDVQWADQLSRERARIAACANLVDRLEKAWAQERAQGDVENAKWLQLDLIRLTTRDGYGLRRLLSTLVAVNGSGRVAEGELGQVLSQVRTAATQLLHKNG
jgi:hypothetical protein